MINDLYTQQGEEITEKMLQQLGNAGVVIEGVNDDMVEEEAVASMDENPKQAVLGFDENPMEGVVLHDGVKETEVENNESGML